MQEILKKIDANLPQLRRYIVTKASKELAELSQPCYYPKTKKMYIELLHILKISDKDVKDFVKRSTKGTKAEKWLIANEPTSRLLVFIMHLFLKNRDTSSYAATMVYYLIVQYARLMHKQIQYCDEDAFRYALDTLTKTHLFSREKTIPNSLYFLSKALQRSFTKDIQKWDEDRVLAFMIESRTRISQSVKSFATSYYNIKKSKIGIKTQQEPTDDKEEYKPEYVVLKRGQQVIDNVTKKITMYKLVDVKALNDAKNVSKIKTSIATQIANELINRRYADKIKILLQLFIKDLTSVQMVCGDEYYKYVKNLMGLKRTSAQLYFKAQVSILLKDIITNLKMNKLYDSYTSQTQFIINTFLAYYVTSILRNNLC